MSYFSQSTLSLTLITTLLILLPSSSSTTLLISQTCKKISQAEKNNNTYIVCVNLLGSDRRSETTKTVEELGVIAFEALRKKIVAVDRRMKALSRSSKFDAFVKESLKFCAEMYSDAVDSIGEALEAYKIKDYDTANIRTSAAMNAPMDCEDGFMERAGETSPVTQLNNDMFELCAIPLVFTKITTMFD